ncbi:hypothetical protein Chor_015110 [Crotalus horridus]
MPCCLSTFRNSLNDDVLLPYLLPQHGPRHHHRYVRDCQGLLHGNATHETWPSHNSTTSPLPVIYTFVSDIPPHRSNRRRVYGHLTVVPDPLRTFSVLEPGGPGGCHFRHRATVEETVSRRQCLVAQNGGYFDMNTGACLGNVVSNGQLVHSSGGVQNAQFGIRKDGTLVFGYLSEEEVFATENPFVQLGPLKVLSILCLPGRPWGMTDKGSSCCFTLTGRRASEDFLKERGVVNAINLDGGGSATFVVNGTLASYPSDHCVFDSTWRCPRSVSTVLCVHEPACQPQNCSGQGHCVLGHCHCHGAFWSGPACDVLDCGPSNCTLHGMCTESKAPPLKGSGCKRVFLGGRVGFALSKGKLLQISILDFEAVLLDLDRILVLILSQIPSRSLILLYKFTISPLLLPLFQWDVSVMLAGWVKTAPKLAPAVPMGMAVLRNASAATTARVTLCTDLALAQRASKGSSAKKPALSDDSDPTVSRPVTEPCLLHATSKEESLFSDVLSNVILALRSCTNKRHKHGQYNSIPLEEVNGGTKDRGLSAAWEVDDPAEIAWDSNQTESVMLL